jgi:hypothetical protein
MFDREIEPGYCAQARSSATGAEDAVLFSTALDAEPALVGESVLIAVAPMTAAVLSEWVTRSPPAGGGEQATAAQATAASSRSQGPTLAAQRFDDEHASREGALGERARDQVLRA